jgi:hypothetical protein
MSERDQEPEDDLEEQIARMEAAGFAFPVSDETLSRVWDRLQPQASSPEFAGRTQALVEQLRKRVRSGPELGPILLGWRIESGLSIAGLRQRVQVDGGVLQDLERNACYPETLPEPFWRRYAEALKRSVGEVADLIASYDRATIVTGGVAAARSSKDLGPEQRAAFLTEPDAEQKAKLDEKRTKLVRALRG